MNTDHMSKKEFREWAADNRKRMKHMSIDELMEFNREIERVRAMDSAKLSNKIFQLVKFIVIGCGIALVLYGGYSYYFNP